MRIALDVKDFATGPRRAIQHAAQLTPADGLAVAG